MHQSAADVLFDDWKGQPTVSDAFERSADFAQEAET
jgi:hypothetical protein